MSGLHSRNKGRRGGTMSTKAPPRVTSSGGMATGNEVQMRSHDSTPVPISLSKGYVCWVDASDAPALWKWKWSVVEKPNGRRYAVRGGWDGSKAHTILMHRQILGLNGTRNPDVDHINRDGLDNTRSNLRLADRAQNNANAGLRKGKTSRFKGVYFVKRVGRWCARANGKSAGYFSNEEDAARAYDELAISEFGEFARTNF